MIAEEHKVGAIRAVLDDYKEKFYSLGEADCMTLVLDYLAELEFRHAFNRKEIPFYHANPSAILRRMVSELGAPRKDSACAKMGDIVMLDNDALNFGIVTGRGIAAMIEGEGLYCFPPHTPIKYVWRI